MKSRIAIVLMCASAALLAGCGKKEPAGQVAAEVNGKDVTLQEINTELQSANVPGNADKQNVQRQLLQSVIDRKLLVGAAEDKGLDKTPEFMAQRRRADEILLAQAYAKQQLAAVAVPSKADIDKYMADHPTVFGRRELLQLEQIRFPTPPNVKALQALENAHTLDQVAATLTQVGIRFTRQEAGLDTGSIPPQIVDQIAKVPAGEPFVIPQAGSVTVNVIKGRRPIPLDEARARPAAVSSWRQEKFGELIQKQLTSLRAGAKITYQNGFAPPAKPGEKAAPAAAAPKP